MSDLSPVPSSEAPLALDVGAFERTLRELELRVRALEDQVATLPDARQLEERITDRVVTRLPRAAPPPEPTREPTFADISLPIPSAATVSTVVQSSWMIWDLVADARTMFWMLVDRRYTKAWLTRVLVVVLLVLIGLSGIWVPMSSIDTLGIGYFVDKVVVVLLTLALGLVLGREMRRYREWRAGR